jgi:hypothetical protein
MSNNKHERTLIELLAVLGGKSSVFCYKDGALAANLVTMITQEMEKEYKLPVIRICWNENELDNEMLTDNTSSFYIFRNFTTALIRIEKLISRENHLIIISDISNLESEQNSRPYMRFLSILLRKNEEYGSTLVALVDKECRNPLVKAELIPHFRNCFMVTEGRIIRDNDGLPDIRYSMKGGKLYLEPYLLDDVNKIKEIFSLTPEEKKELDRIVGQGLEEYRTSM